MAFPASTGFVPAAPSPSGARSVPGMRGSKSPIPDQASQSQTAATAPAATAMGVRLREKSEFRPDTWTALIAAEHDATVWRSAIGVQPDRSGMFAAHGPLKAALLPVWKPKGWGWFASPVQQLCSLDDCARDTGRIFRQFSFVFVWPFVYSMLRSP